MVWLITTTGGRVGAIVGGEVSSFHQSRADGIEVIRTHDIPIVDVLHRSVGHGDEAFDGSIVGVDAPVGRQAVGHRSLRHARSEPRLPRSEPQKLRTRATFR